MAMSCNAFVVIFFIYSCADCHFVHYVTFRGIKAMDLRLSNLRAQGVEMKVRQGEKLPILLFLRHPLSRCPMVALVLAVM